MTLAEKMEKVFNGEAPTYIKPWKVQLYDGTFGYGVSVSLDLGETWQVQKCFKDEYEAEIYIMERCLNRPHPFIKSYYQRWDGQKEESNATTEGNEVSIADKIEHSPHISAENKQLIRELVAYCASHEKVADRSQSLGALLDDFMHEGAPRKSNKKRTHRRS